MLPQAPDSLAASGRKEKVMGRSARLAVAATLSLMLALPAAAEGTLRTLATGDDGKGWEAVGRINIDGIGYCTGTLIAPNIVLTAAHCLYHPTSGAKIPVTAFEFAAGWRNGRAEAYRHVRRAATHPDYVYEGRDKVTRVAYDIALLELDQPVRNGQIRPFATAGHPRTGDEVGIVSYATGRDEVPALQEVCDVLARQAHVLMVSCAVDFGASGAPIFTLEDGEPRIVSVVSAKAESEDEPVALAAELGATLDTVRAELATSDGVFSRAGPIDAAPALGAASAGAAASSVAAGGAKFLRP
jgi:protease YdgD